MAPGVILETFTANELSPAKGMNEKQPLPIAAYVS